MISILDQAEQLCTEAQETVINSLVDHSLRLGINVRVRVWREKPEVVLALWRVGLTSLIAAIKELEENL